jgi:hypothetical protein
MNKRKSTTADRTGLAPSQGELEERIRQRAHELYELRGMHNGHDLDDWLTAESEVTAKSARKKR